MWGTKQSFLAATGAALLAIPAAPVAAQFPYQFPDCTAAPLNNNTVCDTTKNATERAKALVDLFTVEEMINNTINGSPGVARLGVPAYQWWSEGLHGVASSPGVNFSASGDFSSATSFPQPILMSAAFDDPLILQVATVISTEARAFNNFHHAGLDFWTPNINPFRDPRWGRGQETPGEDPYHLAQYVYNLIQGLQGGIDPKPYFKVVADCKHFAGYDIEDWEGNQRYGYNAVISQQDLSEYYLPSFQSCVRDAKVASVMCSYNAVNGIPSCANEYLLQTVLRDYWGFDDNRWVTSDCDAVANIYDSHGYTSNYSTAAAAAINAGTDLNCGGTYSEYLPNAYNLSFVSEETLRTSLTHQYASLVRLGYFDPAASQPYRQLTWSDVNTQAAQTLAYDAAAEAIVLLKNDGTLPFSSSIKNIALIGPWGAATTQMQGNYAGVAPFLISPQAGATAAGYNVTFVEGTAINSASTSGFAAAVSAAQAADAIVFAGGIDNSIEAESNDRTNITWPGNQLDLVAELQALSKPLVVVQFGGGQVDDSVLKGNDSVNAILWAGYPGQSGGQALFDIISGKVAPAGRLPTTQYAGDYIALPMTDQSLRPSASSPGRTYKWYTGEPIYEFGHGLHYTNFSLSWAKAPAKSFAIADVIASGRRANEPFLDLAPFDTLSVTVSNKGSVESDYVALLFVNGTGGPTPLPNKWLAHYTRVHSVAAGGKATASLTVPIGSVSRTDVDGNLWLYPGKYNFLIDTPVALEASFELTGEAAQITRWPADNTTSS